MATTGSCYLPVISGWLSCYTLPAVFSPLLYFSFLFCFLFACDQRPAFLFQFSQQPAGTRPWQGQHSCSRTSAAASCGCRTAPVQHTSLPHSEVLAQHYAQSQWAHDNPIGWQCLSHSCLAPQPNHYPRNPITTILHHTRIFTCSNR